MTNNFSNEITIAVTVYNRREYIVQAVQSALDQTVPVKVIVVEDCGPDTSLKDFVMERFGNRIQYFQNARRRGLFDNWNACIELCETRYLSILHDDDFLNSNFVAAMEELVACVPGCGLYFGESDTVDESGRKIRTNSADIRERCRKVPLAAFMEGNVAMFPGQLFLAKAARSIGGFRPTSFYCGDYEMWANLTARFGAAQIACTVANIRLHQAFDRGTTRVERVGKIHALTFVQKKRVAALLREQGIKSRLDRRQALRQSQVSFRFLLRNAAFFTPRMLKYNHRLFVCSGSPHPAYACLQMVSRLLGPLSLRWTSLGYRLIATKWPFGAK